jgi:hypothetical protein
MRFDDVLSVVPRAVKRWASAIVCCAVLTGLVAGLVEGRLDSRISAHTAYFQGLEPIAGLGAGLLVGVLLAVWLLCLGYVYGDARRRAMPPVLWTLVAFLVPNLLGFLLYFVLRRPITSPCSQCGLAITAEQRFCPWCGCQGPSWSASGASGPGYSRPNPTVML